MSTAHCFVRQLAAAVGVAGIITSCQQAQSEALPESPSQSLTSLVQGPPQHNPAAGRRIDNARGRAVLRDWTRRYRRAYPDSVAHPRAFYISADIVSRILQHAAVQTSPVKGGLRMYMALDQSGSPRMILVGVKNNGEDLFEHKPNSPTQPFLALPAGVIVGETDDRCPSNCDITSLLTTD